MRVSTAGTLATALAALAWPMAAQAHGSVFSGDTAHAPIWLSQGLFTFAWFSYAWGARRRRPPPGRRLAFHASMLVAGVALFGPFDEGAARSTAMHMVQHMLLMVVVAPLAVIARPLAQWRAALGPVADTVWRALSQLSRRPMACALLHAAALWGWHAPGPYMTAVMHTGWHVVEHASFLFTGWLFWWSVLRPGRAQVLQAALALLFTLTHTGLLGAVLTFAREPLYWRESRALWDQQLAGLVMWIPGGMAYLLAAVWTVHHGLAGQEAVRTESLPP